MSGSPSEAFRDLRGKRAHAVNTKSGYLQGKNGDGGFDMCEI